MSVHDQSGLTYSPEVGAVALGLVSTTVAQHQGVVLDMHIYIY